ncbi:MAG: magnesium transporter CorA family protein [Spirochaetia bacterium]|nr:magnesium transporter CorA family protein [Spirochaetia bacterium]MDD7269076.1 magnesium transporter CorA family protein [Treponema sp.]MDY4984619.1 magnesium transporter CorA family protein [Treponema sp.]
MITHWQQIDGQFTKTKKDDIDSRKPVWVDARNVNRDEIQELQEEYGIEQDHLMDILDPDELSRMEDGEGYILTIVRVPVYDPQAETPYLAVPVGIIIKGKTIITLCWTDCEILKDFGNNRVKNIRLTDFPSFIVQIMNRANLNFLRYLKEINRRSTSLQNEMKQEIQNSEIMLMLGLEKSLVYFTTSLRSNALLLQKMKVTKLIKFDEEDIDFVEGVMIDNRQAIEMADTYSNIIFGVMDAFSSVTSNNLNIVMKKLAIINLIMMAPTFITSFFGMNFKLPFETLPGYVPVTLSTLLCIVSVILSWWLLNFNDTKKAFNNGKKLSRKQRAKIKQETKKLRKQEKKLK